MLSYIDVIPACERVRRGESLNLLGGVANDGAATTVDIRVWGRVDTTWKVLATARVELAAGEHRHLYFTLEPECFSEARWQAEVEDIELCISDRKPDAAARGRLVFVEQ